MSDQAVIPVSRKGGEWELAYLPSITDASSKRPTITWLKRRGCCVICCACLNRCLLPLPRVGLQRRRQGVGMISLSHVCPTHAALELNHPSLSKRSAGCTTQDLGREHSILLSVTHVLCVSQDCHGVSRCAKDVSCSSSSLEWKSMDSINGISYYLNR